MKNKLATLAAVTATVAGVFPAAAAAHLDTDSFYGRWCGPASAGATVTVYVYGWPVDATCTRSWAHGGTNPYNDHYNWVVYGW